MRIVFIALGILAIGIGIGTLEYILFPERTTLLEIPSGNVLEGQEDADFETPLSQVSEKNFEIAQISGIYKMHSETVTHLFGTIGFTPEDNVVILKSDFGEQSDTDITLISIYEVFPTSEATVSRSFSYIESKFEKKFENTIESGANRSDDFGIYSFYFNSEEHPEKVFILGVTKDRLIGFEYLKKNHEKLLPLINHLLPK